MAVSENQGALVISLLSRFERFRRRWQYFPSRPICGPRAINTRFSPSSSFLALRGHSNSA